MHRNFLTTRLAVAVLACCSVTIGSVAVPPEVVPLGLLPGAQRGFATAISRDGEHAAGYCIFDPPLYDYGPQGQINGAMRLVGYRWTAGSGLQNLGFPPNMVMGQAVVPSAISGDGQYIVGAPWQSTPYSVFAWVQGSGFRSLSSDLPTLSQTPFWGLGVTDDGSRIVGTRDEGQGTGPQAALLTIGQGLQMLDPGSYSTEASAISPNGTWIVGRRNVAPAVGAYRWSQATGFLMIPGIAPGVPNIGPNAVYADDVTPDGSTVVGSAVLPNGRYAPYRWRAGTGSACLDPNFPGGGSTWGLRVSTDGNVVIGNEPQDGFIWYAPGVLRRFNAYLRFLVGGNYGIHDYESIGIVGISGDGLVVLGDLVPAQGQPGPACQPVLVRFSARPCNAADLASLGGQHGPDGRLTVDDVIVYLQAFFANEPGGADIASLGGQPWPDDQITVDDIVEFLAVFFGGCP